MMDGVARKGIEEAIRFLAPGFTFGASLDDHRFVVIRLDSPRSAPRFFVACADCLRVISDDSGLRAVYPALHKHTEEPISP